MEGSAKKRIRVVIVINDFLIGGAQKLIVDVVSRIDRTQFDVAIVTLFLFGDESGQYLYDALPPYVEVHKLNFMGVRDLGSWRELYRTLWRLNPDIVLSHLFFSNTVTRILSLLLWYRVITVEHNTYTEKPKLHQLIDFALAPLSEYIVAVSRTVATFTAKQEHISAKRFITIHNGIDIEKIQQEFRESNPAETRRELGYGAESKIIVNVARVVPQKNHKLLIDGFSIFVKSHSNHKLLIIGGGSHLEKMRQYVDAAGLSRTVALIGYRKDVPRYLRIADFFVATSYIEGFGITHAEALACGLPVLSTKTAGPDEMINEGVNGFFIPAYAPVVVAQCLEQMVQGDLASMGAAGVQSVERYAIDKTVRAYEALFRSVVERP